MVRYLSGTTVSDATSGFRAFSKDAAMRLNRYNSYTYTLDTIIQAGYKNITISTTPIETNPDLRPSRLVSSTFICLKKCYWNYKNFFNLSIFPNNFLYWFNFIHLWFFIGS